MIKNLLKNSNIEKHIHEQLLLHILNKNRGFIISHDDYCLTDAENQHYQQSIAELQQGKPLAYVIGSQGFWKHEFLVNEHTLIPRPDTEFLIEIVLNYIQKNSLNNAKILDLGTGTGCIAISLADEQPKANVIAIDFSEQALKIAKKNAERIGVNNIQFLQSNWFDKIGEQKFDIIVSNPPYIAKSDEHLANLSYEPITALVAKDNGLADIEHIVKYAKYYLSEKGLVAIEHGYNQAKSVREIFCQNHFQDVQTMKDYGGNDRITFGEFCVYCE